MELDTPQNQMPFSAFAGRNVFVTGHTGFKGSWLALWLAQLGANVSGLALAPSTQPNNFELANVAKHLTAHHEADIRDQAALATALQRAQPDFVFHLAAQPLVRRSYAVPHETVDVNVVGTSNVLNAVRSLQRPCVVIVVTSDKCYADTAIDGGCRESDALGGSDPYSASKAATEIVTNSYRASFFSPSEISKHGVQLASVRAGNVIGGGDWSEDRIVTDIVRSLQTDQPVQLRNPLAVRPWQHVLDALGGYLLLADRMFNTGDANLASAWNFGPHHEFHSVETVTKAFIECWGHGVWEAVGRPSDWSEAKTLTLNVSKAREQLGWKPVWEFAETISKTASWYRHFVAGTASPYDLCRQDIEDWHTAYRRRQVDAVIPPLSPVIQPTASFSHLP